MPAAPRPQAAGRPAALRRLPAEIEEDHTDEIAALAIAAERGSIYQRELGRRREGPQREKYEHLPREQQRIARQAMARIRNERRRLDEARAMPRWY